MVRLKHRYLLVNILYPDPASSTLSRNAKDVAILPDVVQFHQPSPDQLTPQLLQRMIRDGVAELFGEYGSGMIHGSLSVKYFSSATSTAIIRVTRAHYRLVWAALTYITRLPRPMDMPCVFQVVRVSGTIRKSEEEAIRRAKASILRAHRTGDGNGGGMLEKLLDGRGSGRAKDDDGDVDMGIEDPDEDGDEDDDDD